MKCNEILDCILGIPNMVEIFVETDSHPIDVEYEDVSENAPTPKEHQIEELDAEELN